jgi:hypothetical protein
VEKVLTPGVGDGGVEVGQGNSMTMRDKVVRADESSAEAVRDDGGCVVTYVGNMFDGLYLPPCYRSSGWMFQAWRVEGCSPIRCRQVRAVDRWSSWRLNR